MTHWALHLFFLENLLVSPRIVISNLFHFFELGIFFRFGTQLSRKDRLNKLLSNLSQIWHFNSFRGNLASRWHELDWVRFRTGYLFDSKVFWLGLRCFKWKFIQLHSLYRQFWVFLQTVSRPFAWSWLVCWVSGSADCEPRLIGWETLQWVVFGVVYDRFCGQLLFDTDLLFAYIFSRGDLFLSRNQTVKSDVVKCLGQFVLN